MVSFGLKQLQFDTDEGRFDFERLPLCSVTLDRPHRCSDRPRVVRRWRFMAPKPKDKGKRASSSSMAILPPHDTTRFATREAENRIGIGHISLTIRVWQNVTLVKEFFFGIVESNAGEYPYIKLQSIRNAPLGHDSGDKMMDDHPIFGEEEPSSSNQKRSHGRASQSVYS
ncbi:hypothetical protein Acr_14g0001660 [Actinidia rufa]|uniref:Uncharacterized protein n=1 Tax=Actinidia rufa TaxID=165716 RepID=A0A7J0FPG6_9ERIC|nr:hypothetical protein Acr_14g0001660 [Actinidia rufa]